MIGLLLRGDLSNQQMKYAQMAATSAESLLALINDILDFSKVEAGKLDLELVDFDAVAHIEEIVELLAVSAQHKGIEIVLDTGDMQHVMIKADPGRLRQILVNLIGNAIKFTESGEVVVRVTLKSHEDCLNLNYNVTDTGIGIDQNKVDHLFESFTQIDSSTTREYGGTGLGLAIVKQLCQLMSGEIRVVSKLHVGSEFNVNLRVAPSDKSPAPASHQLPDGQKMLIVDGNKTAAEVLSRQLHALGAKTSRVTSIDDALLRLRQPGPITSLFVDTKLLEQLTTEIGNENRLLQRPEIFLMTNLSTMPDELKLQSPATDACISKPITATKLKQLLFNRDPRSNLHSVNEEPPPENKNQARILLVEDNVINTELALDILEDLGYETDSAENGRQAIDLLKASDKPFDLILMDCQMPVLDGYEATREIRLGNAGLSIKQIPILALTAHAMEGDRQKCLACGMDDYIAKPIDIDIFKHKIDQWLTVGSDSRRH